MAADVAVAVAVASAVAYSANQCSVVNEWRHLNSLPVHSWLLSCAPEAYTPKIRTRAPSATATAASTAAAAGRSGPDSVTSGQRITAAGRRV